MKTYQCKIMGQAKNQQGEWMDDQLLTIERGFKSIADAANWARSTRRNFEDSPNYKPVSCVIEREDIC